MKKSISISILMLLLAICMYGQKNGSIYEVGDSIVNYETNFENLIKNWTTDNITNADEYTSFRYAFVETITDSIRYKYYRNYFTGDEVVSASTSRYFGVKDGLKYYRFFIRPGYAYSEFYDTRGMTEKQKTIMSEDFRQKAKDLLKRDFDVDKMNLKYYTSEFHKNDTTLEADKSSYTYNIVKSSGSANLASPDSISANYIDIISGKKKADQFDTTEKRRLKLEELLIDRTVFQLRFNKKAHLGDKVYAVQFDYYGKTYTNYVICSSKTKKVVWDNFFPNINLAQPEYPILIGIKNRH